MSRLDSFIRRVSAQRDILNDLKPRLDAIPGPIFEFGLGGGRTLDHLRELFPARRIIVFECMPVENPLCHIPSADLVLGDIRQTTSEFSDGQAALIHTDIESGVAETDAELTTWLPGLVARLLASGGYAASGCILPDPRLLPHPLPPGVNAGRYHVVRRIERSGVTLSETLRDPPTAWNR